MKAFLRTVFAVATLASALAVAQQPQGHPPHIDIAALLDVDAARAQQVQAILDDGREKMREAMETIRQDTDRKLSAILTPDQVAKLKASMPRHRGPGRERGNPQ